MAFKQDDSELIPFSNATFRVYSEMTGADLSPFGGAEVNALLHDVAQAIASVVPIYGAISDKDVVKPLPPLDVKQCFFLRGATIVQTSQGIRYGRLYIRRGDVRAAVTMLKHVGTRFSNVEEIRAAWAGLAGEEVGGQPEDRSSRRNASRESVNCANKVPTVLGRNTG